MIGSSISSLSLAAETPEVYNSDAQSPIYGCFDDIGTFGGNNDRDSDGNMYHTSGKFGSSQYSPSLAAELPRNTILMHRVQFATIMAPLAATATEIEMETWMTMMLLKMMMNM